MDKSWNDIQWRYHHITGFCGLIFILSVLPLFTAVITDHPIWVIPLFSLLALFFWMVYQKIKVQECINEELVKFQKIRFRQNAIKIYSNGNFPPINSGYYSSATSNPTHPHIKNGSNR